MKNIEYIKDILDVDPNTKCSFHYELTDTFRNRSEYDSFEIITSIDITSDSFLELLQKKVTEYKSKREGEEYYEYFSEFLEWLGVDSTTPDFIEDLCNGIGCTEHKIEKSEDDTEIDYDEVELDDQEYTFWFSEEIKDGPYTSYHENGQLENEGNYKNGEKSGVWKEYWDNGQLFQEWDYTSSKNGIHRTYWKNGQLFNEYNYKEGKKDGIHKSFTEEGQLHTEVYYKDDTLDGPWKEYHENGKLWGERNYKNGKMEGSSKSYYENGQLWIEDNWEDHKKEGPYKLYYENGQLQQERFYKNDEEISRKCWDEEGNEIECK